MKIENKPILATICLCGALFPLLAQTQQGKATYYSKRSTGARTASGERLHHDSMTCAHRFHPFGTLLKVTNMSNGRSVVVRVTDRGPFGRGKVIDLSWGAAKAIDMLASGVQTVKIEVVGNAGVPFKANEEYGLPEIDFEVANVGYSFIEAWKHKKTITPVTTAHSEPHHQTAKTENKSGVPSAAQASTKEDVNTAAAKKNSTTTANKRQQEGNAFSRVFDKIKHWGEKLF